MRSKFFVAVLFLTVLVLVLAACGPKPAPLSQATPTSVNQLATVAPEPTEEPAPEPTELPAATDMPEPTAAETLPTEPAEPELPENLEKLTFTDDFSDPNSGWGEHDYSESWSAGYQDGAYQVSVDQNNFFYYHPVDRLDEIGDSRISVEVQKLPESGLADFGVVCGFQDDQNFTTMGASTDGDALIYLYEAETSHNLVNNVDAFTPPSDDQYLIVATCNEGHYKLEVNGETVIDYEDERLVSSGSVGLYLGTFDEPAGTYLFDNFAVEYWAEQGSQLPQAATPASPSFSGDILFFDDFSTKDNDWDVFSGENGSTGYANGLYEISVSTANYSHWANPNAYLGEGDAVIEVDARISSGSDMSDFGIICGYEDVSNFHILAIANDGYVGFTRYMDGEQESLVSEENVFTPVGEYHLVASCIAGRAQLYANGELVLDAQSDELLNKGGYGLYAGTFDDPNVVVQFDNFTVRKP